SPGTARCSWSPTSRRSTGAPSTRPTWTTSRSPSSSCRTSSGPGWPPCSPGTSTRRTTGSRTAFPTSSVARATSRAPARGGTRWPGPACGAGRSSSTRSPSGAVAEVVDIPVGARGLAHLEQCLAEGRTLSHLLLERGDLRSGTLFTWLPPEADHSAVQDFRWGGKLLVVDEGPFAPTLVPIPNTNADLADRIRTFLRGGSDRLCVLQDPLAEPSDASLSECPSRLLTLGPDVYHVLGAEDVGQYVVE